MLKDSRNILWLCLLPLILLGSQYQSISTAKQAVTESFSFYKKIASNSSSSVIYATLESEEIVTNEADADDEISTIAPFQDTTLYFQPLNDGINSLPFKEPFSKTNKLFLWHCAWQIDC